MTYSEFQLPCKEQLREAILSLYGRDIGQASVHYSTRNYAFCISEGPFPVAIRLGIGRQKTREAVLSELMFVDYLKISVPTVSQPVPSVNNRVAEEVDIDGEHYCITMFRKANGGVLPRKYWTNAYFEEVGRVIGKIHRASNEANELGFRFKRHNWYETIPQDFSVFGDRIPKAAQDVSNALVKKIKALPQTPGTFGMIHGDYCISNLFSDWESVWVFDFDDSNYGFYMYDIASAFGSLLHPMDPSILLGSEDSPADRHTLLTHLRKGYEEFYTLPQEHWDLLEDFCVLHIVTGVTVLLNAPIQSGFEVYLNLFYEVIIDEDGYLESTEKYSKKIQSMFSPKDDSKN